MRFRPRSILSKLLTVFVAAAVLPLALLGFVFYSNSMRAVADMAGNRTARIAQSARAELDRKLELRAGDHLLTANQPVQDFRASVREGGTERSSARLATLRSYLGELFVLYGDYYEELVLADTRGEPVLLHDRSATVVIRDRLPVAPVPPTLPVAPAPPGPAGGAAPAPAPPFRGGIITGMEPAVRDADRQALRSALDLEPGGHRLRQDPIVEGRPPTVSLILPVVANDRPEVRLGYVLGRMRASYLWPEDWANRRFGELGHLAVVDPEGGVVLYHTRADWVGRRLGQVDLDLAATINARRSQTPAHLWTEVKGEDGSRVISVLPSARTGWLVAASAVPREFASEARRAAFINLVVSLLSLLAAVALIWLVGIRMSRSIRMLTARAERIATGDWSGPPFRAETHDEVRTLAEAFNVMTEKVRRDADELERRVHERTQRLEELNAALGQANERLRELDRLKSNFLATVSHEFKTPLTNIKSFAEIVHDELAEREAPAELLRFLRIIDTESDRLARLIKNVLDLSQIESGRMTWRMSDFEARGVIEATIDGMLPALKEKRIELEHDLPGAGAWIHGDPDRIQQVFTNVLDNAIQASSEGQCIWLGCREDRDPSNGDSRLLRVSIRDQGYGIPAEELERIFDRFHQVGTHIRRRKEGTGLGLAICREITEHHGGRIWAESEPGRGSTFHITLPLAACSSTPSTDPPSVGGETPESRAHD
jgi:signal transduction histidine kinase